MKSSIEKQIITINNIRDCKTMAGNPDCAYGSGKAGKLSNAGTADDPGMAGAADEVKIITIAK